MLRPYVQAKGVARVCEMLEAFVQREDWEFMSGNKFNKDCVLDQPLTIQGFVTVADRLEMLLNWESEEVPYDTGS